MSEGIIGNMGSHDIEVSAVCPVDAIVKRPAHRSNSITRRR
ncbi:hypothetical protein FBZ93_116126 [Bradyrhizobium macuxiense]|uniref:Uncharacterized protein n=1 Tax=Bradyrhizobium macuxiense TaxID=1755647 RepID=A0A560L2A5_9BRAD|nr:hypothetical protein FBZ93_116126 [Bradyrhizobium macuxiense]